MVEKLSTAARTRIKWKQVSRTHLAQVIGAIGQKPKALAFGPFELDFVGRRLTEAGRPVAIGSRALELLIALLERPGELVTKAELIARAWPDTQVEPSNIRVQMSAVRRALKDRSGEAYIVAASGRGYRFVAPLEPQRATQIPREHHLPASLTATIGREADMADISERLSQTRLLTIVGPGGIGKTTLSLSCARELEPRFVDGAIFVEVTEAGDLAMVVAGALGLRFSEEAAIEALTAFVAPLDLLVVLDSCEYAIEEAARLSETILRGSPNTTILCTSREPLLAEGETAWRIDPLGVPPDDRLMPVDEALDFPAVRLFVDRASAVDRRFLLTDSDVGLVSSICRRLDGLPLAIELAAGRVSSFGLAGLESALDDRFQLLLQGRRTAMPRHRSLAAAIDWSYESLSEVEQRALRCLSLFQGPFDADAAAHHLIGAPADREPVREVLLKLVAKSLIVADLGQTPAEYRLLDTTRDYARRKLEAAGELSAGATRHAASVAATLARADAELERRAMADWLRYFGRQLQDVRAALDWAFAPAGDKSRAVPLTLAAVPVWMRLGRFEEAARRLDMALGVAEPQSPDEVALQIALAFVAPNLSGMFDRALAACERAVELAARLQSQAAEFRANWALWNARISRAHVSAAYESAVRLSELAINGPKSPEGLIADRAVGLTELLRGNLATARSAIERVRSSSQGWRNREVLSWYAYDPDVMARNTLVALLWLEGKPDSAVALASENAARALEAGNENLTSIVLADGPCLTAVMVGDETAAEGYLELLDASLRRGGAAGLASWTKSVRALLAARRGDAGPGLAFLNEEVAIHDAHPRRVNMLAELAEALGHAGAAEPAKRLADSLLERVQRTGQLWIVGEVQRVRAQFCADDSEARSLLEFALETAQQQGALAWELRAATSLARRWPSAARPLLARVLESFTEGHSTRDLIAAREVLATS